MTPTAPIRHSNTQNGLSTASAPSGLGLTDNIETAFQQSTNGRVRAKIIPERILDVRFYETVKLPTAGATNIQNKQTLLEADLSRSALQFLMDDTGLKEIEVLGPAETSGANGSGGNGGVIIEEERAGFFERNWPWILGGGAVLVVGAQLLARSGRRRMAAQSKLEVETSRSNPDRAGQGKTSVILRVSAQDAAVDGPMDSDFATDTVERIIREFGGTIADETLHDSAEKPGFIEYEALMPNDQVERFKEVIIDFLRDIMRRETYHVIDASEDTGGSGSLLGSFEPGQSPSSRANPPAPFVRASLPQSLVESGGAQDGYEAIREFAEKHGGEFRKDPQANAALVMFGSPEESEKMSPRLESHLEEEGFPHVHVTQGVVFEKGEGFPPRLRDNQSAPNDSADFWIARATVNKDEMDRGNVHRTSMASNIASLDMEDQRRIASNLAVAPGGKVTVWKNAPDGLKEQRTFRWSPDNGFSPTE